MFHVVKLSTHTAQNTHVSGSTTADEAAAADQAARLNASTGTSLYSSYSYRGKKA